MEVSRQEYWSGLSFPSPGDLSDPGSKLRSPALQAGFFFFFSPPAEPPGKPVFSAHLKPTQYCESTKTLQLLKLTCKKRERERRKEKEKGRKKEKSCLQEGRGEARLAAYRARNQAPITGKVCALRLCSDPDRGGMRGLSAPCGAFLARPRASPPSRAPFPSRRRRFSP